MNKNNLRDLLIAEQITVDELALKSNVSKRDINRLLSDELATVTWHQAMSISDTIDKIILERRSYPNTPISSEDLMSDESIELQLARSRERIMRLKDLSNMLRSGNLEELENVPAYKRRQRPESLFITIDKGNTPDEEIATLLAEISLLYRMSGGSGINFEIQGIDTLQVSTYA